MYLTLDPSHAESLELTVRTRQGATVARRTVRLDDYRRSTVLTATADLLLKVSRNVDSPAGELQGVLVVNGFGRFTTLRLAVAVANTFGWLYNIPVRGASSATAPFPGRPNPKKGQFLKPVYSGEPNITKARRKVHLA